MLKKITNFVKYHNAFVIVVAVIFTAAVSTMAASEDLRDKVLGEKIVTKSGIDNSRMLNVDLENFDMKMEIIGVDEDDEKYYLDYQYQTMGIKDNVWQNLIKQKKMEVSKKSLAGRDLGLYIAEELGEVIDSELAYLKKVQTKEEESGEKVIKETVEYKGLLGLVINTKTKELPPDYELVVKPKVVEYAPSGPTPSTSSTPSVYIPPEIISSLPQCDSSHLNLCNTQELCEEKGLYWRDGQCNDDMPAADSAYYQKLKELCEANDLFWYDQDCHDNCQETAYYLDSDSDGFGDLNNSVSSCALPVDDDYVLDNTDCDDSDEDINTNISEICDDEVDNDCDGDVDVDDEDCEVDETLSACDSVNLNLCSTQIDCKTAGGYWYDSDGDDNNDCNATVCVPDWVCSEWSLDASGVVCGDAFTQTRACVDSNNCGVDQDKPEETQDAVGTDASGCGATSCDGANLVGECNNICGVNGCEDCVPTCLVQKVIQTATAIYLMAARYRRIYFKILKNSLKLWKTYKKSPLAFASERSNARISQRIKFIET